jgi:hypothetical protein
MLSPEQRTKLTQALGDVKTAARLVAECRLSPTQVSNSLQLGSALSQAEAILQQLLQGS